MQEGGMYGKERRMHGTVGGYKREGCTGQWEGTRGRDVREIGRMQEGGMYGRVGGCKREGCTGEREGCTGQWEGTRGRDVREIGRMQEGGMYGRERRMYGTVGGYKREGCTGQWEGTRGRDVWESGRMQEGGMYGTVGGMYGREGGMYGREGCGRMYEREIWRYVWERGRGMARFGGVVVIMFTSSLIRCCLQTRIFDDGLKTLHSLLKPAIKFAACVRKPIAGPLIDSTNY